MSQDTLFLLPGASRREAEAPARPPTHQGRRTEGWGTGLKVTLQTTEISKAETRDCPQSPRPAARCRPHSGAGVGGRPAVATSLWL